MPDFIPPPRRPARTSRPTPTALRSLRPKDGLVVLLLIGAALHFGPAGSQPTRSQPPRQAAIAPTPLLADMAPAPLVAEVGSPSYAPGSTERAVFDALNDARAKGDFGLLAQDPRLDAAAAAHAQYMAQHLNGDITHRQDPQLPGFSGETPLARVRAAGYETVFGFEAVSRGTSAPACLELLNTVYHLGVLMMGTTDVGIAVNPSAGCVIEAQLPGRRPRAQARPAGAVGVYPYPGQAGVPPGFMPATEIPNPAPDVGDAVLGPPILVDLNSQAWAGSAPGDIVLSRFVLSEAAQGTPVATRILASPSVAPAPGAAIELRADRRLASAGHVFLLPMQPLKANTNYAVEFSGSVAGMPLNRRWDFSTR